MIRGLKYDTNSHKKNNTGGKILIVVDLTTMDRLILIKTAAITYLKNINHGYSMEFHPKNLPILETFEIENEKEAQAAVERMAELGFKTEKAGFKVLMPKETRTAKRIGYTITTGVTYRLREQKKSRDIKYWTYHHDDKHYAIVLIDNSTLRELGF